MELKQKISNLQKTKTVEHIKKRINFGSQGTKIWKLQKMGNLEHTENGSKKENQGTLGLLSGTKLIHTWGRSERTTQLKLNCGTRQWTEETGLTFAAAAASSSAAANFSARFLVAFIRSAMGRTATPPTGFCWKWSVNKWDLNTGKYQLCWCLI